MEKLNATAKRQIDVLANDKNLIGISKLDNQKLIEDKKIDKDKK